MAKKKVKVHWRGTPGGIKHAVRELDGRHLESAACGAVVHSFWTSPGVRRRATDRSCKKCTTLEPLGLGPGGENYKGKTVVWIGGTA